MDADDLRRWMRSAGVDLWGLIDTAISVAATEQGQELRARRDGIVQRLYATPPAAEPCRNCGSSGATGGVSMLPRREEANGSSSPVEKRKDAGGGTTPSPESMNKAAKAAMADDDEEEEEEEEEEAVEEEEEEVGGGSYDRSIDEEKSTFLEIKQCLEDPDQSEDSLVKQLQNLVDMDITFKALKESDIGRHVNNLRKHPSNDVRRLSKLLVRKWKDLVDNWVRKNSFSDTAASPAIITDGDSPQQNPVRNHQSQNEHHVPEFGYSPNPRASYLNSERNSSEPVEPKAKLAPTNPAKANGNAYRSPSSASPALNAKEQKDNLVDAERFASARKRLHENYLEAQNAKKNRTIQVMDIHEIPKPKNGFVRKGGFPGKNRLQPL